MCLDIQRDLDDAVGDVLDLQDPAISLRKFC